MSQNSMEAGRAGLASRASAQDGASPLGPEQTYFQSLAQGEWRVPRCLECGKVAFYPRVACVSCGAAEFDWIVPAGFGTIYSTTVMRRPAQAGGDRNLCLVDLDEGFRMMSRIEDAAAGDPKIGERVRAGLQQEAGQNVVVFTRVEAA